MGIFHFHRLHNTTCLRPKILIFLEFTRNRCNSSTGVTSSPGWFSRDAYAERLFLFAHPIWLPLSIYLSVPPHANKPKSTPMHPDRGEIWWKRGDQSFRKAACVSLVMTVFEVFTKTVYRILVPLGFLIFVTNKRFSVWAPLDDFRKERISKSDAIIFSGVCNKQGVLMIRAIKWLLQTMNFNELCH